MDTLMEKGQTLSPDMFSKTPKESEKMKHAPYAKAIGSFMYTILRTRLDIYFAIELVSRY